MEECPICFDSIRYPSCVNPCNHMFCEPCINRWLATKQNCPVCRTTCSKYTEEPNKCITNYYGSDKNLRRTVGIAL